MGGSRSGEEVTGAILAGGRARRFQGRNKATLDVFGRRLIERQIAAMQRCTAEQLVVANDASAFSAFGVRVVADVVADAGPLGGLATALETARSSRVLVLACDLPFVHEAFLQYLIARAPEADAVVPRTVDGLHPLCAVYAQRVLPVVRSRLARRFLAVHGVLGEVTTTVVEPCEVAPFDREGYLLANINTAAEYGAIVTARDPLSPGTPDAR